MAGGERGDGMFERVRESLGSLHDLRKIVRLGVSLGPLRGKEEGVGGFIVR
jgi:hypothetical protein